MLTHRSLRDDTPRSLPKISLVFYNARTSFKTKQSNVRRLTRSAAWGPSVDEIEPTQHFAPLPGSVQFYVRLRTKERPSLSGPGWQKPLQTAHGYASRRSLIWPTASLEMDRIVGYSASINSHLARVLELEVCVPGDVRGVNPTLETHYQHLNLETVRNRLVLEDGTTRISIPLLTKPRIGLEGVIASLRPGPPPAAEAAMLGLSPRTPTPAPALVLPAHEEAQVSFDTPAAAISVDTAEREPISTRITSPFATPPSSARSELIRDASVPRPSSPFLPRQSSSPVPQLELPPRLPPALPLPPPTRPEGATRPVAAVAVTTEPPSEDNSNNVSARVSISYTPP